MNTDQIAYLLKNSGLHEKPIEVFSILLMDKSMRLVRVVELSRGTWDHVMLDPKAILEKARYWEACNVVLCHHHPDEAYPIPSPADVEVTKGMRRWLRRYRVKVVDHIVLGSHGYSSIKRDCPGFLRRIWRALTQAIA